jgi:hypothetical protein
VGVGGGADERERRKDETGKKLADKEKKLLEESLRISSTWISATLVQLSSKTKK